MRQMGNATEHRQGDVFGLDRPLQRGRHRRLVHHLLGATGDKAGMDHAGRDDDDADLGGKHRASAMLIVLSAALEAP